ncbi:3-hydroxybenzoate 6-hydroxylase 1 [Colletotrichum truncatum]|uniref:3-hydroxybenzoate 6-hydroxylase 1 n=1 Tax=Colletotrichum truncatum TaxID=5467 RepID=A0ACC3ZJV6_COLTU|nr:3-hydroxybenzoate 6-hydroxylase 1 [Colletotrichum truncatum]KAF6799762.1 3-hydroxybenzoate 6-hydroxylase 1 [Colletotrichum truncatum]
MTITDGPVELNSSVCYASEAYYGSLPERMSDPKDLKIAVIGAGMGGLGCALALAKKGFKHVDVYETASTLGFVGAGIQMPPNVVRTLDRLGCWPEIEKEATDVKGSSIRQGSTNVELAHVDMPNIRELYGYPHCNGHRSSLAGRLYDACKKESAVKFHFATSLTAVNSFDPKPNFTVQPRDGEAYSVESDVLLACDGIKSTVRSALLTALGAEGLEEETGQAAYRIMLTREQMAHDPELLALLDSDDVIRWIGEKRHIIAYPVSSHSIYNLSTTQPDSNFAAATNATYTTKGSKSAMLEVFHDFCPLVHRMLNLVPDGQVCEWRLRMHKPLPSWVHTDGPVALLGDACHPTLPHLSQGAAMAIEDGSVVAEVLSRAPDTSPQTLRRCLKAYELSRREWCSQLVNMAFLSGKQLHLGEGKAKEERDRMFAEHKSAGAVPDKWASPDVQKMIYSNDCVANIQRDFDELYKSLA